VNLAVSGLLHDLAHIYRDEPKRAAYRRAAAVIAGSDRPLPDLVHGGRLEKLPGVGPSIERTILEYLETGVSSTVDRALADASRERQRSVARRRGVRANFLSVARARQVLLDDLPGVIQLEDYRGDLQQHSLWSDGSETLDEIADSSLSLGQQYAALTDHFALPVAGSLSAEDFARQHEDIDALNDRLGGRFRLLKGVEANILADGAIEMLPQEMQTMELVVASPHSLLRRDYDQTARMVNAVTQPGVHILGHPRGRRFNDREGVIADWDEVFHAAAERQVAIEIDGSWERQDVDFDLAARALTLGCVFALDSDAHGPRERHFSAIAVAHARLARIHADRVINCWPLGQLLEWLKAKG
jgi:histidinol phosphatase-like PHP family hydrolase